jgi:hypothetical protein
MTSGFRAVRDDLRRAAGDVVQAGLDHWAADAPEAVAGRGHSAAHLWDSLL